MMQYHIRTACGSTIDWVDSYPAPTQIPDGAWVFAVNKQTGVAVRIR